MNEVIAPKMGLSVVTSVDRMRKAALHLKHQGLISVQHFNGAGKQIGDYQFHNGPTNVGLNEYLDIMWGNETQITAWYIGLIQDGGYTGVSAGDTMSSHSGWTEYTGYDETDRVPWTPGNASSQSITNATPEEFTINTADSLKGLFLVSDNTKSGTTGILAATGLFASDVPVAVSDTFKVTIAITQS